MNIEALHASLYKFFSWHPARITIFLQLIFAMIKAKSVTIKDLAMHVESKGNLKAKITKVERWFLKQSLDFSMVGKLVLLLFSAKEKVTIAIDRTNWQFGKSNLNFFAAGVVYGNLSIPIACLMLEKKGSSSTEEREKLANEILKVVEKNKLEIILGDREFIGEQWTQYLSDKGLPFGIRVKKSEHVRHKNGGTKALGKIFNNMYVGEIRTLEAKYYGRMLKFTCLQLEIDQLIIASNVMIGEEILQKYKQRWSIERTFKALKSAGFNIEDTHMTDTGKLLKLFAIASVALAVCILAGTIKHQALPIKIKNHGRALFSMFTYGLDLLNEIFLGSVNKLVIELKIIFERRMLEGWS